jgi:hypothetical protein
MLSPLLCQAVVENNRDWKTNEQGGGQLRTLFAGIAVKIAAREGMFRVRKPGDCVA